MTETELIQTTVKLINDITSMTPQEHEKRASCYDDQAEYYKNIADYYRKYVYEYEQLAGEARKKAAIYREMGKAEK
ncbi:MAG: hypothetical protein IJU44_00955 [Kiritimatiellae bacterium]|nr:hypothetical protein [Kiritimatiellia bacterium]